MERFFDWLFSRPPIAQANGGLREWIDHPYSAAPVEIGRVLGIRVAVLLAVIGWVLPLAYESGNTPFDRPAVSSIGALTGVVVWQLLRHRFAQSLRLSAAGLEVRGGRNSIAMPWSALDPDRRAVLVNGLMLGLPLKVDSKLVMSCGAIVKGRDLMLLLLQRVRPADLVAAVNAGTRAFGSPEPPRGRRSSIGSPP